MNNPNTAQAWIRQRELVEAALRANGGAPGVPPGSALAGKSGLQIMQSLLSGELPYPHMAQTMDVALIEIGPGHAVFQGTPQLKHYNPMGVVHGGWFATLLDFALGCAVQTTLGAGVGYTTAHLSVHIVRAATIETGAAEGHRQSRAQWPADGDIRSADRCAGRQAVRTRHDHLRGASSAGLSAARGSRVVDWRTSSTAASRQRIAVGQRRLRVDHCRPRTSAIRCLNWGVSFPAVRWFTLLSLAGRVEM